MPSDQDQNAPSGVETVLVAGKDHWLAAARRGDQRSFEKLAEPHRRELLTHCYRMLGSLQDAEEIVQETLLRAWRRLHTYQARASFRAWLYRIATNACIDLIRRRPGRSLPPYASGPANPGQPLSSPITDPVWLEPFPDELLAPLDANPESHYEAMESISFAFLIALQTLPGKQRAVLILRDVLDWRTAEVSDLLEISMSAVHSLLYRARRKLSQRYPSGRSPDVRTARPDEGNRDLLKRYVRAWEQADIDGLVALLREDATFPMPPSPAWYQGRAAIRQFIANTILDGEARGRWRLLPVAANGLSGFAWYRRMSGGQHYRAFAIQVLTIKEGLLADVTTFGLPFLFPLFGLDLELEP